MEQKIIEIPCYAQLTLFHKVSKFFNPIILFPALLDIGVLKTQKTAYGPKKWLFSLFFSRSEKSLGVKEKRYSASFRILGLIRLSEQKNEKMTI